MKKRQIGEKRKGILQAAMVRPGEVHNSGQQVLVSPDDMVTITSDRADANPRMAFHTTKTASLSPQLRVTSVGSRNSQRGICPVMRGHL